MEWISVKERLPGIEETVLVYHTWDKYAEYDVAYISEITTRKYSGGESQTIEWRGKDRDACISPTHWMSLPEPPKP